jgi:hypothetical protein
LRSPTRARSRCTGFPFGGPALFLLAQILFLGGALGYVPRSRPRGLAALAVLAPLTAPLSMLAGVAASTAVLGAVAAADTVAEGGLDQSPEGS